MRYRRVGVVLALAAILGVAACGGNDKASTGSGEFNAKDFFAGKTVHVIVTHSAGGGTDIFGRFIADRLGDALPGHPRVTVTNVDGLGGISTVFDAKEGDLVVGVTSQASTLYTTILDPADTIDPTKVQIVGGMGGDPRGFILHGDVAEAFGDDWTLADGASGPDLKFAQVVGGPSDITNDSYMESWLCDELDWPCDMASVASDDSQELDLMVQRGELNTHIGVLVGLLRDSASELESGDSKLAFSFAPDPATTLELPSGLTASDITDGLTDEQKADFEKIYPIVTTGGLGKHFWAGPDTSAEVLDVYRQAFTDVLEDPATVADMAKAVAGGDESDFTYEVSAVDGATGQTAYDENTTKFVDNLDYYTGMQQQYYDEFWK